MVDLVSNAVQPKAQSHPELLITQETNNYKTEQQQLVCVRSFPIHLEEKSMDEICVQMMIKY